MTSDATNGDRDLSYLEGRQAYPGVDLAPEAFAAAWDRHAAGRGARWAAEGRGGGQPLSARDLYLATACDVGVPTAWETFCLEYLPRLRGLLRKHGATEAEAAEVLDDLPGLLCERPPNAPGHTRIGTYDGSGRLISWLSIFSLRAVNGRRRPRAGRAGQVGDELLEGATLRAAAPKQALETEAVARFQGAIAGVWSTLTPRERLAFLLKHRDHLSGREVARVLGVGEPRVSRILASGLEKIRAAVARGIPGTPPGSRTPDRDTWMALTDALERHLATLEAHPHDLGDGAHG